MFRPVLNLGLLPAVLGSECSSAARPLDSKCEGCPPMYNGKLCASTTRYNDQTKGPCGCGATETPPVDQWTFSSYTAALNAANLNPEDPSQSWCPSGCGSCYRVCSTGGKVQGGSATADVCRVFKISNRCGDGYDSNTPDWCSQRKSWQECAADSSACVAESSTNKYGYAAHFDLMDMHGQITKDLQWDNPEVTFEPVPCTEWEGPSWDCACDASEGNSSTTLPTTDTTTPMTTTDPSVTTLTPSTTEPTSSTPAPTPAPTESKCAFDCSGGCESCTGFSKDEYCFSQTTCEGDCGGKWCPSTDPVTTTEPQPTTPYAPTSESTTQVPPTTETTTGNPPPEGDGYCPSVQDLVVAYGSGVVLKDQGWTVSGDAGAATKAAYNLNGGSVEYDIDVSDAKSGTIPNVYSIAPSGIGAEGFVKDRDYCDGADQHNYPWCVEVDWIESNGACGGATTVHTIPGTGAGTCNAWGCRTEYHNDAPKFHMRIDYDAAGRMTVSRDGQSIAAMNPAPQASDFDAIREMHDSTGAVIYSSMWTGSWVPGPEDCGAGPADLTGSSFTISNLKIHGSVVQGPEPQRCSSPSPPTTVAPVDPTTPETTTAPVEPRTPEPTTAPVEPTTPEPTTAPVEPTTQEPTTVAPVEPTTPEPTTAPVEPTTQEPTTVAPVDPTTPEPTTAPVEPAQCEVFPNHEVDGDNLGDAGITDSTDDCCEKCSAQTECSGWTWAHDGGACQLKGNLGEPRPTSLLMTTGKSRPPTTETTTTTTTSSSTTLTTTTSTPTTSTSSPFTTSTLTTTTIASSTTTSTSVLPVTTTHSTPDSKRCRACNTMCAPCRECASSKDGSCSKCWQCWDNDDDEDEDEDDECNALDHDHDWDDDEVQCLSEKVDDCRECWEDVPVPTTTTTTQIAPSAKRCRACNTMCSGCQSCVDSEAGECEKCWRCWDYDDDEDEDDDDDCNVLHKDHEWNDDEVQCLSKDVSDCRLCWSMDIFTV